MTVMNSTQRYETALALHRNNQLAEAEAQYLQLLKAQPQHADALHLLGVLCHQTGRHAEAADLIGKAIQINPRSADFLNNQGLALRAAGRFEDALNSYQRALKLMPGDSDLHNNLGNVYLELKRFEQAADCYRRVLRAFPDDADIKNALCHALQAHGNQCHEAGLYVEAQTCLAEALQLRPGDAALQYNLGNALRQLGKPAEAAASYRNALKITPNDADIHNNLGNVLRELGLLDEAIACYEQALQLDPALHHAKVHLVHQRQHICDWRGLEQDVEQIRGWVNNMPQAQVSPFAFLAMPGTTAEEQRRCAENWVSNRYQSLIAQGQQLNFPHSRLAKPKLRIGYLSGDFRLHPLAFLISELIELHDRERFEIFAYSYATNDLTPTRKRLERAFDHFVDIRPWSPVDTAKRIHADQIDILVDLTGFTQGSRTSILALSPAPLQVSWLGFPGTMGAPFIDYLISDAFITPPDQIGNYSEKLVLLPDCYQPNDRQRPIGAVPTRATCNLPDNAFVFCCFNQSFKITPQIFEIWMRLLKALPNSVLWLLECNSWAKANLFREAVAHGVAANRLVFAPRVPIDQHLARHTLADLFLDTLPYNAHTTTSDALWMGLPVLTCVGETFASRVAGSLLQAARLPELITHTLAEYEAHALHLAHHPDELGRIRQKLAHDKAQLPLFDTTRFARHLEQTYRDMWRSYVYDGAK